MSVNYDNLRRWLYWPDTVSLDIIYATAGHILFTGDPLWLLAIGPSGSGKTELIRTFRDSAFSVSLDIWNSKSFISGYEGKDNIDLLPQLNNRLLLIKDFTGILGTSKDNARELIDQLRGIYDGYWDRATGLGQKGYASKFGILAGCTPAIDSYRVLNVGLGDRFLRVEWPIDEFEISSAAAREAGDEDVMRRELTRFTEEIMGRCLDAWTAYDNINLPGYLRSLISLIARLIGVLRTQVVRDFHHQMVDLPTTDAGGRTAKNLAELAKALCCLYEIRDPNADVVACIKRVAWSMVPKRRRVVLQALLAAGESISTTTSITAATRMPYNTTREEMEDLWAVGALDRRKSGKEVQYRFALGIGETLERTQLIDSSI